MRSPSKSNPFFLRPVALLFLLWTFSSVFARVPLVRRQSNVESQWLQAFPGVVDDGPKMMGNNLSNEQVVADTYPVCCTQKEYLIEKTFSTCEGGMSFFLNLILIIFLLFFFSNPHSFLLYLYLYGRKVKRKKGTESNKI